MRFFQFLTGLFLLFPLTFSAVADNRYQGIKAKINKAFPRLQVKTVRPSPVRGFYEIVVGSDIFYVSADGNYILAGSLISVKTRENLTEKARGRLRQKSLTSLDEKKMIIFGKKRSKRTLTVFTDIDCPFCAKLHLEVPTLNQHGVRVRYLLYPRGGIRRPDGKLTLTYQKHVSVWCTRDRRKALTEAKAGKPVSFKTCKNPVAEHYALGQRMGLRGTPMIITDDGKVLNGYMPAAGLLQVLKIKYVKKAPKKKHQSN